MAKKTKLTEEQLKEIKILQANAAMLEKTKKEAEKRDSKALDLINIAQQEVYDHISQIDADAAKEIADNNTSVKEPVEDINININSNKSVYDALNEINGERVQNTETEQVFANSSSPNVQYDVISLPSNGEGYKNKMQRIPVAYLTAYDENLITSPSLYRDGLVIDCLLKSKIVNKDINTDDLLSGDVDAIILFLRATSYGVEFPITVRDPETGAEIESVVDLSKLKPKEFKLKGDENGYFDFTLPLSKDVIKFKYLTRRDEKNLELISKIETKSSNASLLSRNIFEMKQMLEKYEDEMTTNEKTEISNSINRIEEWRKKLSDSNDVGYNKIITNRMEMNIVSVNGNKDRKFIHEYINSMRAKDSLDLRRYINENEPGIDFTITVERPQSLGGGSFNTFLEWNDSVFLNIA